MAVVTKKSGSITNRDTTPKVLNNPGLQGGNVKYACGTIETGADDDIGSKYIFCSVPSNAFIKKIALFSDDVGTTAIADFGVYKSTLAGGAVGDADLFGSAVSLKDGAINGTDITHESGAFGVEDIEKPLWEALGLSSDPGCLYDIVATLTAATDASATVSIKAEYV